jgi:hypothetical protein
MGAEYGPFEYGCIIMIQFIRIGCFRGAKRKGVGVNRFGRICGKDM